MRAFSVSMEDVRPSAGIRCSLDPDGEEDGKNGRLERGVIGIGSGDAAKSAWLVGNSSGGGDAMTNCDFDLGNRAESTISRSASCNQFYNGMPENMAQDGEYGFVSIKIFSNEFGQCWVEIY
jgi:hypothetical protein